ncbi:MAG: tetrathionate reductase family octaheme c-type cytochrome [Xanthomonadales bacterium]|nr:tetrathionate reductase family octaheme c-type cytochrome [Xanthomonadales bacterium]
MAGLRNLTQAELEILSEKGVDEFAEAVGLERFHELWFQSYSYEGTASCLECHGEEAADVLQMGHFKWAGKIVNIEGLEGEVHGKKDLVNNFCVAVGSNEPRCTQCHIGYGYKDDSFDFSNPENIDCLVCHDQTGTYQKGKTSAGMPDPSVDLDFVAQNIAFNGGEPTRKACIGCHAKAGGGDNVKHGDISTDLIATTREFDVHMGVDGGDMVCVDCHASKVDPDTGKVVHGIPGMALHSVDEGDMQQCEDCHTDRAAIHANLVDPALMESGWHDRLACQVCHIPAIARAISTKTEWYWADAGMNVDPIPIDETTGRPTYDKKKGSFVWKNDVRPVLRYANGTWRRKVIGVNDQYDQTPVDLGSPVGSFYDDDAMIYPFKLMVGNQPADVHTQSMLVPHLFGTGPGPNPFWGRFDWHSALEEGAAYNGQDYSGGYEFVDTTMLLSVNHEIAPAEDALGQGMGGCVDCHMPGTIDWEALGWTANPISGGARVPPSD